MTYAIGEIVYGVNLKNTWDNDIVTPEQREAIDNAIEEDLIHASYSGNGDEPNYVGPVISDIDEGNDVEISSLVLTPTDEHREIFRKEVEELVSHYPVLNGLFDKPTMFITWGSS